MTLGRAIGSFGLVAIGLLAFLFASSLLVSSVDRSVYRARAAEALDKNVFVERTFFPFAPNTAPYKYNHNDCLILSMLTVAPAATPVRSALSPRIPSFPVPQEWESIGVDDWRQATLQHDASYKAPKHGQCYNLVASLNNKEAPTSYYHRYIHGYWTLSGILLAAMSFSAATMLLYVISLVPSLLILAHVLSNIFRKEMVNSRDWSFAAAAFSYLLVSGVSLFGWSLSFAPGEIVLSGFLLFAYLRPLGKLSDGGLFLAAATFGCLTAAFEFLTGGIPAGVALLLGLLGLDQIGENGFKRAALAVFAFCAGVLVIFGAKAGAVSLVWGSIEVAAAGSKLQGWTDSGAWEINASAAQQLLSVGISPDWLTSSRLVTTAFAMAKLAYFSDLLTWGSKPLGLLVCVGGPLTLVALSAFGMHRRHSAAARVRALLLFGSAASVVTWYAVFVSHTILHAYFMQRPLAWLFIIAMSVLCWRLSDRLQATKTEFSTK